MYVTSIISCLYLKDKRLLPRKRCDQSLDRAEYVYRFYLERMKTDEFNEYKYKLCIGTDEYMNKERRNFVVGKYRYMEPSYVKDKLRNRNIQAYTIQDTPKQKFSAYRRTEPKRIPSPSILPINNNSRREVSAGLYSYIMNGAAQPISKDMPYRTIFKMTWNSI